MKSNGHPTRTARKTSARAASNAAERNAASKSWTSGRAESHLPRSKSDGSHAWCAIEIGCQPELENTLLASVTLSAFGPGGSSAAICPSQYSGRGVGRRVIRRYANRVNQITHAITTIHLAYQEILCRGVCGLRVSVRCACTTRPSKTAGNRVPPSVVRAGAVSATPCKSIRSSAKIP